MLFYNICSRCSFHSAPFWALRIHINDHQTVDPPFPEIGIIALSKMPENLPEKTHWNQPYFWECLKIIDHHPPKQTGSLLFPSEINDFHGLSQILATHTVLRVRFFNLKGLILVTLKNWIWGYGKKRKWKQKATGSDALFSHLRHLKHRLKKKTHAFFSLLNRDVHCTPCHLRSNTILIPSREALWTNRWFWIIQNCTSTDTKVFSAKTCLFQYLPILPGDKLR